MSAQTAGRVLASVVVGGWVVVATLVGIDVFGSSHCVGHSGEPFWRDWSGGRRVCGIDGPELYRFVLVGGAVLALGVLLRARARPGPRFWGSCAVAAVLPVAAYALLRLAVAVG